MRTLIRWSPVGSFATTDTLMNWMLDGRAAPARAAGFACDVADDGEAYIVRAALPGFKPEELEVTLDGRTLTIRAEAGAPEGLRYHIRERATGRFERSFRFGLPVDGDAVESHYESGVLTVRVPRAAVAQPRRIEVRAGGEPAASLEEQAVAA